MLKRILLLLTLFILISRCINAQTNGFSFAPCLTTKVKGYYINNEGIKTNSELRIPHSLFGKPLMFALRDGIKIIEGEKVIYKKPGEIQEFGFEYKSVNYVLKSFDKSKARCRTWILFVPLKLKEHIFAYKNEDGIWVYKKNIPGITRFYLGGYVGYGIQNIYLTRKVKL